MPNLGDFYPTAEEMRDRSMEDQLRMAKNRLSSTVFDSKMIRSDLRSLQMDLDMTQHHIKMKEMIERHENPGLEEPEEKIWQPEETDRTIRPEFEPEKETPTEYYDRRRSEIEEREWTRADAKKKQAYAEFEEGVDKRTKEALAKAEISDSNYRTHMYALAFLFFALYIAHPDPY